MFYGTEWSEGRGRSDYRYNLTFVYCKFEITLLWREIINTRQTVIIIEILQTDLDHMMTTNKVNTWYINRKLKTITNTQNTYHENIVQLWFCILIICQETYLHISFTTSSLVEMIEVKKTNSTVVVHKQIIIRFFNFQPPRNITKKLLLVYLTYLGSNLLYSQNLFMYMKFI